MDDDTHDVQGKTIVADDFNNSDGGPINVTSYVLDFYFCQINVKVRDCWRYFFS